MIDTYIASTNLYLGSCATCDRPYRVDLGEKATSQQQCVMCPGGCSHTIIVDRLAAVTTTESCDSRCMGATGPSCSCACGGANHGAGWGTTATRLELESAVASLRARQDRLAKQREARQAQKEIPEGQDLRCVARRGQPGYCQLPKQPSRRLFQQFHL